MKDILESPYNYIDSRHYSSCEQYFTALLVELTKNTKYSYTKSRINPYYISDKVIKRSVRNTAKSRVLRKHWNETKTVGARLSNAIRLAYFSAKEYYTVGLKMQI